MELVIQDPEKRTFAFMTVYEHAHLLSTTKYMQ